MSGERVSCPYCGWEGRQTPEYERKAGALGALERHQARECVSRAAALLEAGKLVKG